MLLALLALAFILACIISFSRSRDMKVVFFDVGQGDAILISQGGTQLLIDSGKSGQVLLEKLGKHIPFWDRKIETVLMTHPDQDHIGGFADIFKSYEVRKVIKTNAESDSQTFKALEDFIAKEGSDVVEGKSGVKLIFPSGSEMEIIYPFSSVAADSKDTNGSSIVSILKFEETEFLLTGDLTSEMEDEILRKGVDLSADVLKVGHHGSKYSTGEKLLEKVSPRDAIISVGRKNSYGHPAPEVLERLGKAGAKILKTYETGDIVYDCLGLERKCVLQN